MARLKIPIRRPWIPYIIFIVTLILTVFTTYYISKETYTEDRLRFLNAVQDTNTNIRTQIDTYIAVLRGTAGLFSAEPNLTEDQFNAYVNRLRLKNNYGGAMGLGYTQKVNQNDLDTFIQTVQNEDDRQLTIRPPGERPVYFIIRFLIRSDQKTVTSEGFDIYSNPVFKKAMDTALDSGLSAASGMVTINDTQTKKKIPIFAIFTPVYSGNGNPNTVDERRKTIQGFVFMPFNADTLLNEILGESTLPKLVDYKLYDSDKLTKDFLLRDTRMLPNDNQQNTNYFPRFHMERHFTTAATTWTILFSSHPQFELESNKNLSAVIFIGGLLVSLMFFKLTRDQYIARNNAEYTASQLKQSQKELQKAVSHRDNFISIASHELKTPVTSLKVYAEVLLRQFKSRDDVKTTEYLVKINRQIDKLTLLIQDLLNVSRIQTNQLTFRIDKFDLNDLVKEVIENTQQIADHQKIQLVGSVKQHVWGDRERIGQVLVNLLTNAIKFSPRSGKIIVKMQEKNDEALILVTDFGIGINKEHQKRIFERFYRISEKKGQTFPGLGIGLFISQAIIRRHGGEITIKSDIGKGSTFIFNLPFNKRHIHSKLEL